MSLRQVPFNEFANELEDEFIDDWNRWDCEPSRDDWDDERDYLFDF